VARRAAAFAVPDAAFQPVAVNGCATVVVAQIWSLLDRSRIELLRGDHVVSGAHISVTRPM